MTHVILMNDYEEVYYQEGPMRAEPDFTSTRNIFSLICMKCMIKIKVFEHL